MPHTIEPARSGRARCKGCREKIAKDELRFGERMPNPYDDDGDSEMTLWFHVVCGAYMRSEPFLDVLTATDASLEKPDWLKAQAEFGVAHRRLPRLSGAGRAPTGRARCRSCREMIEKGDWRLSLMYYEEGRLEPSGYVHCDCSGEYLTALLSRFVSTCAMRVRSP